MATENSSWGYDRIVGALDVLFSDLALPTVPQNQRVTLAHLASGPRGRRFKSSLTLPAVPGARGITHLRMLAKYLVSSKL
jgi:hypothetical protein